MYQYQGRPSAPGSTPIADGAPVYDPRTPLPPAPAPRALIERKQIVLAAAMIYNPILLIIYLVYQYSPSDRCYAGALCSFDQFPGILQAAIVLAGAALLWFVMEFVIRRVLERPRWYGWFGETLAQATNYRPVRLLFAIYGALLTLALLIGLLRLALPAPIFLLGLASAVICLYCAFTTIPPPATPPAAESPRTVAPSQPHTWRGAQT